MIFLLPCTQVEVKHGFRRQVFNSVQRKHFSLLYLFVGELSFIEVVEEIFEAVISILLPHEFLKTLLARQQRSRIFDGVLGVSNRGDFVVDHPSDHLGLVGLLLSHVVLQRHVH